MDRRAPKAEQYRLFDAPNPEALCDRLPRSRRGGAAASGWKRLCAAQGALTDRLALRGLELLFVSRDPPALHDKVRERLDEARRIYADPELLADPARFFRPVDQPNFRLRELGRLRRGRRVRVTYPSQYRTYDPDYQASYSQFERNEMNRVHLWLHEDAERPTVVCAHTWCGGTLRIEERLFGVAALYRMGLNVALVTLPFHGSRTPREALFPGQLFPSRELRRSNEAFGQAVSDIRVLMTWLRQEQGCGAIGMMGMSLGGYITALMASLEPSLAFAIPIVAPCSFADILWYHGQGRPGRQEAEQAGVTGWDLRAIWSVHSPLMYAPQVARERLLIVWGEGDRVVPTVHQLALWEHWENPTIRAFPGGHVLQFGWRGYRRAIRRWLDRTVL